MPCQKKLVNWIISSLLLLNLFIKTLFSSILFRCSGNHILKYVKYELKSCLTIKKTCLVVNVKGNVEFSVNLSNFISILKSALNLYERKGGGRNES